MNITLKKEHNIYSSNPVSTVHSRYLWRCDVKTNVNTSVSSAFRHNPHQCCGSRIFLLRNWGVLIIVLEQIYGLWVSFSIVSVGLARGWQWSVCTVYIRRMENTNDGCCHHWITWIMINLAQGHNFHNHCLLAMDNRLLITIFQPPQSNTEYLEYLRWMRFDCDNINNTAIPTK